MKRKKENRLASAERLMRSFMRIGFLLGMSGVALFGLVAICIGTGLPALGMIGVLIVLTLLSELLRPRR